MKKILIMSLLIFFALLSCKKDSQITNNLTEEPASVNFFFQKPAQINHLVITAEALVTAADMDSIRAELTVTEEEVTGIIEEIPAGLHRKFEIFTYDSIGNLTYYGRAFTDVPAGQQIQLNIILYPENGTGTVIISGTFADYPHPVNKIIFEDNPSGSYDIFMINIDGSNLINLTNTPDINEVRPRFTPNGSKVTYTRSNGNNIQRMYTMDLNGNNQHEIGILPDMQISIATYSPQMDKLAFYSYDDGDAEIYVYDFSTEELIQLTFNSAIEWFPKWSPDGEWVLYQSKVSGIFKIYAIHPDGSDNHLILPNSNLEQCYPEISSNGEDLLFYGRIGGYGGWDLFKIKPDGSDLQALTNNSSINHCHGSWSPDGQNIIYLRYDDSALDGLYIMDKDGNNNVKIHSSDCGLIYPDWN